MEALNINQSLVNSANSASMFDAGNIILRDAESVHKNFDSRFPITEDLTNEQVAYLEERRIKWKSLIEESCNDQLRRRASWVPVTVAGPSNYDSNKMSKRADAGLKKSVEWGGKIAQFLENTANRLRSLTPPEIIIAEYRAGICGEPIMSDDPYALDKLQAKLAYHTEQQELMKKVNTYYRKHKTCKGCEGISDDYAAKLDATMEKAYSWETAPFASYSLSNNNAVIKQVQDRIERQTQMQARESTEETVQGGIIVRENTSIDRLQIIFPDKPSKEQRDSLKKSGFRWAPSEGAWQRQLTNNARYAAKKLLEIN